MKAVKEAKMASDCIDIDLGDHLTCSRYRAIDLLYKYLGYFAEKEPIEPDDMQKILTLRAKQDH